MVTIENLLRFLKYFNDKIISVKNFPLGFVKVQSTHFFCFLHKCGKRKDCANELRHLESCHVRASKSSYSLFQVSSFIKC